MYAETCLGFDICRNIVSAFCRNPKFQTKSQTPAEIPNPCRNPKLLPKSQTPAEIPNFYRNSKFPAKIPNGNHCEFDKNDQYIGYAIVWDFGKGLGFRQEFGISARVWDLGFGNR